MAERLELESEHGRRVMGILLFQDLAVVPLLVLIPALDSTGKDMAVSLGWAALKAGVLLTLLLVGGQRVMRWWLTLVARRKSEELFILNLLLVTLGLAWLTEHFGLSLALGAFVAGMLVAETEYKHQVETDIRPFHDVLLGLFFITIGMMLDWRLVLLQWPMVLLLLTVPVLFKLVLITGLAKALEKDVGDAVDFGTLAMDTTTVKTIEAVFLGVDTDGDVFVRLVAGLDDTLYRVVERESVSRALCKRGVGGRQWNVSLEVANATYLNLDMIELSVASMARRWSSR